MVVTLSTQVINFARDLLKLGIDLRPLLCKLLLEVSDRRLKFVDSGALLLPIRVRFEDLNLDVSHWSSFILGIGSLVLAVSISFRLGVLLAALFPLCWMSRIP